METIIIKISCKKIDKYKLDEPARILRQGGLVAFPTETVYGLGANALDEKAVKKIFEAKGRPSDNPLIVHISDFNEVEKLADHIPEKMKILADEFWPGPLTMIVKKSEKVPDLVTAGLDTVAIRFPSHPIARTLIDLAGVPVAAPSANISGKPSTTSEDYVIEDLMGRVDVIICGGDCIVGVESTVLDLTTDVPTILRPGAITKEDLERVIGKVIIDPAIKGVDLNIIPKSPGMKYTHYKPKADVIVFMGGIKGVADSINEMISEKEKEGLKVGVMATEETKGFYKGGKVISVGSRERLETVAANLFKVLRDFDKLGVDIILAEGFEEREIGQAIMNRLSKAAGYNIIKC